MSEALVAGRVPVALADAHAAVDELFDSDLTVGTDDELLEGYRELERLARRLAAVEHGFIAEVAARSIPWQQAKASTAGFLRGLLRLHPAEATARVKAAQAAGPRRALTGEPLPPLYPKVAAAQAAGQISARHAQVIVRTIDTLPDQVEAEHGPRVEADLVGHAHRFDPHALAQLGQRVHDCLDSDGRLRDHDYRQRTRALSVAQRPDGSATVRGQLSAECTERLLGIFDCLGAPKPEPGGQPDPRSAAQRRHDALLDALKLLPLADALPTSGGVATTVIVTLDAETYRTGRGTASTGHGAIVPAAEALKWAGGDQRLLAVAIDKTGRVEAQSSTARLFTETQRLALIARDRGCTFPACDIPAAWTEIHHVTPWAVSKTTSLDNAAMVCGFHHRSFEKLGWTCIMTDGRPAWIPPPHVDPEQKPMRNHLHNPTLTGPP